MNLNCTGQILGLRAVTTECTGRYADGYCELVCLLPGGNTTCSSHLLPYDIMSVFFRVKKIESYLWRECR